MKNSNLWRHFSLRVIKPGGGIQTPRRGNFILPPGLYFSKKNFQFSNCSSLLHYIKCSGGIKVILLIAAERRNYPWLVSERGRAIGSRSEETTPFDKKSQWGENKTKAIFALLDQNLCGCGKRAWNVQYRTIANCNQVSRWWFNDGCSWCEREADRTIPSRWPLTTITLPTLTLTLSQSILRFSPNQIHGWKIRFNFYFRLGLAGLWPASLDGVVASQYNSGS